jgi:hypothetical protein
MMQLPNWFVMIVIAMALGIALWMFARTREDIYADVEGCTFDDPRERLKELEAAFAAGLMTPQEFERLKEKLGVEANRKSSGISSRTLPKTWDDVSSKRSES